MAQGSNPLAGYLSGGISSGVSSGIGTLGRGAELLYISGGLSGGIGSAIGGGNFWDGVSQGLIVAGLKHAAHSIFSGDPTYDYNGKEYNNKRELYRAILLDEAAKQFGIKDLLSLAAALDGTFPSIDKRFSTPCASKKTSYVSKYASKYLPYEMPRRLPTHINLKTSKVAYTKVLGRFVGRLAGPVGWAILSYDVGMTFYNTQKTYNTIIND